VSQTYSFVIPVHDEEESLPLLAPVLTGVMDRLDGPCEVLFVDDGSTDRSLELLLELHARDPRMKVIHLARNFGHQMAVTAGIDLATGDAVITMDADLQDPPDVVLEMAARWRDGFDIVYGRRTDRTDDTWLKRNTAGAFYRLIGSLSPVAMQDEVGDFRLMDRRAVDALRDMHEHNRYLRGMVASLGFRQTSVDYRRPARLAGETSYTARKMCQLAADGLVGFSKVPLHAVLGLGAATMVVGSAAGAGAATARLARGRRAGGLERLAVGGLCGGLQLVAVGVLGEYVGRIHDESLGRPLYSVRSAYGIDAGHQRREGDERVIWLSDEAERDDQVQVRRLG